MNRLPLCHVACVGKAGVGVLALASELEANPVANAVAVMSLEDITKSGGQVTLPEGAIRLAVSIKVGFDDVHGADDSGSDFNEAKHGILCEEVFFLLQGADVRVLCCQCCAISIFLVIYEVSLSMNSISQEGSLVTCRLQYNAAA